MHSTLSVMRTCANGGGCVAYAQLGEPARLSRHNSEDLCWACCRRRLDEELLAACEPAPTHERRPKRRPGTGSIAREQNGRWRATFFDTEAGRRRSITRRTREQVEAELAAALAKQDVEATYERSGMEETNGNGFHAEEAPEPAPEKLYSVNQAAELLSMHPESVRREIRSGEIRVEKLSPRRTRIAESELLRFRRERTARYGR